MTRSEIIDVFDEGLESFANVVTTLKLLVGGLVIAGIGVTQALFGWVGGGFVFRVLYPIPLILFGGLMVWGSVVLSSPLSSGPVDEGINQEAPIEDF